MPLSAADRLEIAELYARYAHAVDDCDGQRWAACFTADGSFVPSVGKDAGRAIHGHDALSAFGASTDRHDACRHWTSNLVLTERADGAVDGTCYGMLVRIDPPDLQIMASAVYHDEILQEDGAWRFRTREPRADAEKPM